MWTRNLPATRGLLMAVIGVIAACCILAAQNPPPAPNPAYAEIVDVPGLPRVLLIGDSISVGYTLPTRRLLEGKANLHRIPENGGPSTNGIEKIDRWLGRGRWDVIHFNWGLHDLKIMEGGRRQVPLADYERNLRRLVTRLKQTGARLIWASTTPVPAGDVSPPRRSGDVTAYNRAAANIMEENGVAVNDLYSFALPRLADIQRPVNVHFTDQGSAALAKQVAAHILAALGKTAAETDAARKDYFEIVQAYADAMIRYGRDRYGPEHTPLFAATLGRQTLRLPEEAPAAVSGIRESDRTLTGANPMHDQNLYQVFYALAKITGDQGYADAADDALQWFLENCQSPATKLFAWGEHLGWDFQTEAPLAGREHHEFYRPWVLAGHSFRLAPQAFEAFTLGLWQHQIADQRTGEFSRHARFAEHGPNKGREFPRHGGFYIAVWATAYERSKNPELLKAIETLVTSFDRRRHPNSDAIPSQAAIPDLLWPQSGLSLAIDLWDAAGKVPAKLASKMRASASRSDEVFLKIKHDLSPGGRGFIKSAITGTLEPGDPRGKSYPYSNIWATGYGEATDAQIAMLCLLRYEQIRDDRYRELFLAAAQRYLKSDPDTSIALYPGAMAEAIAVMLGAYRLTGDEMYLARADEFGRTAAKIFFEGSPLPKASSRHDHYEAITRGDTLVMELLDLWVAKNRPGVKLGVVWNER